MSRCARSPKKGRRLAWPDVILSLDGWEASKSSKEPPTRWIYFTKGQFIRYLSDRSKTDPVSSIRTFTVVGDYALFLAHYGIHLAERDAEDVEELLFGTNLEDTSPLFLLPPPYASLAVRTVFCDPTGGPLTPERCESLPSSTDVWLMTDVPTVYDSTSFTLMSLNEYAHRALQSSSVLCINAQDRRDLLLLLQMVPMLAIDDARIGADAFVYFLSRSGTPLPQLLFDYKTRKLAKCRQKAISGFIDPVDALRVFDNEMGQSEELTAQRCSLLDEVLRRQIVHTSACHDDGEQSPPRADIEENSRLCAELEEKTADCQKWKSYAEKLAQEMGASSVASSCQESLRVSCGTVSATAPPPIGPDPMKHPACCAIQ